MLTQLKDKNKIKFIFVNLMIGMYRGGGENYDLNLSEKLIENGNEVEFIFLKPIFSKLVLKLPDKYICTPVNSPWLYYWSVYISQNKFFGKLKGIRGIPRAIGQFLFEIQVFILLFKRRREKDIIHICGLGLLSMLSSIFLKKKFFSRFPGPPSYKIHNFFIKNTYAVIANGDAYKQIKNKVPLANLIYINVGINFKNFVIEENKNKVKEKINLSVKKVYFICW